MGGRESPLQKPFDPRPAVSIPLLQPTPRRGSTAADGPSPPRRGAVAARGRWRGQVRPAPRCGRRRLIKEAGRAWLVVRLGR